MRSLRDSRQIRRGARTDNPEATKPQTRQHSPPGRPTATKNTEKQRRTPETKDHSSSEERSNLRRPTSTMTAAGIAPLQINDKCQVRWRGGVQNLPAVVVERRASRKRKQQHQAVVPPPPPQTTTTTTTSIDELAADQLEYYVHYLNHDRRLDEWVTFDKIVLESIERREDQTAESMINNNNASSASAAAAPMAPSSDDNNDQDSDTNNNTSIDKPQQRRRSSCTSSAAQSHGQNTNEEENEEGVVNLLSGGNWHGSSGDPALAAFEREHEETTKVKNIEKIIMGNWEVEAWYYSPFPEAYSDLRTLYVCEYCLSYMKKLRTYRAHRRDCPCRKPPGTEIYREGELAAYELDGKEHRAYCQKLCLLSKLFLDHKTLYYDVTPFLFYVVARVDEEGSHIVGYFSKEKVSSEGYNLACILTFPQFQKSGYGKFIISLSYELTKREGITGSPEKPLSDLGKVSYRSYWTHVLMNLLSEHDTTGDTMEDISIEGISFRTGIRTEDIISTLQSLQMIKVWKGAY